MEDRTLRFFVAGTPVPMPKKLLNRRTGVLYPRDPKGRSREWIRRVVAGAEQATSQNAPGFFLEREWPVDISITFFLEKARTNKRDEPVQVPDLDNLAYSITNALQGVAYANDCQIVRVTLRKTWTSDGSDAGALVTVRQLSKE